MATAKNQKIVWIVLWLLIIAAMYAIIAFVPQEISFDGKTCQDALGRCSAEPCFRNESADLLKSGQYAKLAQCGEEQYCCIPHSAVQTTRD